MLGLIEIVFSCIGIFGICNSNLPCMVVGLIGIIIGDFIDIFVTGHNPITIVLACMFAIGVSIANKDPLYGFTIALCGENLMLSIITIGAMGIAFIFNIGKLKDDTNLKYVQLSEIIMQQLNTTNLEEAIEKSYNFYKDQGVNLESINLNDTNKYKILATLVMLGLDCDNIDEALKQTNEFYNNQKNEMDKASN